MEKVQLSDFIYIRHSSGKNEDGTEFCSVSVLELDTRKKIILESMSWDNNKKGYNKSVLTTYGSKVIEPKLDTLVPGDKIQLTLQRQGKSFGLVSLDKVIQKSNWFVTEK